MTVDTVTEKLRERFGQGVRGTRKHGEKRVYVDIDAADIVAMARFLYKDLGLRFAIASAVDEFEGFEILYHFAVDRSGAVVSLRVLLKDREHPAIDTITGLTRAAWWIEREIHELFGIMFTGNTDLRPLLLSDDWPKGVYPMRKDFVLTKRDSRKA